MAIFHLKMTLVRRGEGRSAAAAAAYRSGSRLLDERTGQRHDYQRRGGVIETGISGWTTDRETLWNTAERAEKHPRAVIAREIVVALPFELSADARRQLTLDFAEFLCARHGVAVDWAIHAPPERSPLNHHAHLLLTTRRLGADRSSLQKKSRELDNKHEGSEHIATWRRTWTQFVNEQLWRAGFSIEIDHRSHKSAGRDREAAEHLGPKVIKLLDNGIQTDKATRNAGRRRRNLKRAALERELKLVRREITRLASAATRGVLKEIAEFAVQPSPPTL